MNWQILVSILSAIPSLGAIAAVLMAYQGLRDDVAALNREVVQYREASDTAVANEAKMRQSDVASLGGQIQGFRSDFLDRLDYLRGTQPGRYKQ